MATDGLREVKRVKMGRCCRSSSSPELAEFLARFSGIETANFQLSHSDLPTMPFLEPPVSGQKRKRDDELQSTGKLVKPCANSRAAQRPIRNREEIRALESAATESRKHYNNIAKLLAIAKAYKQDSLNTTHALLALCRVFCRLHAGGQFDKSLDSNPSDEVVLKWLNERQSDFIKLLAELMCRKLKGAESAPLDLWMQLVKQEVRRSKSAWTQGLFATLIPVLLRNYGAVESARDHFVEEYFTKFRDGKVKLSILYQLRLTCLPSPSVQFYTLELIKETISRPGKEEAISSSLGILFELPETPPSHNETISCLIETKEENYRRPLQINALKKRVEEAWLCILRSKLDDEQRKAILKNLVHDILPWFNNVERLADFLTDSYDVGGSTSLLALSGVYHLIQAKNLDYPSFYQKLYSLLDEGILYSQHRSLFFRHLDTFMSSTHLPAALVASFIKRLSRLALHAPPAGIVAVVPWIYNMFKKHPQCTFMIHRVPQTAEEKQDIEEHGFEDPFDMEEPDPMKTNAIDSCIWEIETLQSHYHPNVATLAKIISEQFTKQSYNMEDFLDYSYTTLIDAELEKGMKKAPVVEHQIPKRIFTTEDEGLNDLGKLLTNVMNAGEE